MCFGRKHFEGDPQDPYYDGDGFNEYEETQCKCLICGGAILKREPYLGNYDDEFHIGCFLNTPQEKLIELLGFEERCIY